MSGKDEKAPGIRINAFLAKCGVSSRRGAESLILEGRVKVNGIVVHDLAVRIIDGDAVELDGKRLSLEPSLRYLALHKPPGYLCSSSDPHSRPLAIDLLPKTGERLYSVGRLDFLSSGLIFFTNDGEFASLLVHPSTAPEKEYLIETDRDMDPSVLDRFVSGVTIEGVRYKALRADTHGPRSARIILVEGKNREIRRVLAAFGVSPRVLRRVRIGAVELGNLPEGESRSLTEKEIQSLMAKGKERTKEWS
jgi:23S rRNA pseudouridine2605 synthase